MAGPRQPAVWHTSSSAPLARSSSAALPVWVLPGSPGRYRVAAVWRAGQACPRGCPRRGPLDRMQSRRSASSIELVPMSIEQPIELVHPSCSLSPCPSSLSPCPWSLLQSPRSPWMDKVHRSCPATTQPAEGPRSVPPFPPYASTSLVARCVGHCQEPWITCQEDNISRCALRGRQLRAGRGRGSGASWQGCVGRDWLGAERGWGMGR